MKQATVNLPSGTYLIIGVTYDSTNFMVYNILRRFAYQYGIAQIFHEDDLPPGSWQLLGADPTRLTEEEAGEIVGTDVGEAPFVTYYRPYGMSEEEYINESRIAENELEQWEDENKPNNRLSSLAASLGIEKPFVVLKNIEK